MAGDRKDTENNTGVIRMPQQHVYPGRGVAGYQTADGDSRVEVYPTKNPFAASTDSADGAAEKVERPKSRKELDAEAALLGLDPADYGNKDEVAAAIAAKLAE